MIAVAEVGSDSRDEICPAIRIDPQSAGTGQTPGKLL